MMQVIPYERKHYDELLSLMFYTQHYHAHFDWHRAGAWLDDDKHHSMVAVDENGVLCGALALSLPLYGKSWLRLAIVSPQQATSDILHRLWHSFSLRFASLGVQRVGVLVNNTWIESYLSALGFAHIEQVITLFRNQPSLPPLMPSPVHIENAYLEHLKDTIHLDHQAFVGGWEMSMDELRLAQRQSASAMLAWLDGQAVGYQISTRTHNNAHLVRLAALPTLQGKGIGALLLHTMIERLQKRGVKSVTVNTQASNQRSQALYARYGFVRIGFDLPVWEWTSPSQNAPTE